MNLEEFLTFKTTDQLYRDIGVDKALSPYVERRLRTSVLIDDYKQIRKRIVAGGGSVPSVGEIKADLEQKFAVEGLPLLSWIQLIMLVWKIWRELRATGRVV